MTALAGIVRFDGSPADERTCMRMLETQRAYAKDLPRVRTEGSAVMGRALFRLLPEDVHDRAPVHETASGRLLAADVRLDNRDDLCVTLGISVVEARSLTDSQILFRALDRWELDAVHHLVGDFAFVWWNEPKREVVLARDFAGQRPLHYHRREGRFAFASMPSGLHALSDVPIAPDRQAMTRFLALLPEYDTSSFFEGIEKVPPGHIMTVSADRVSLRRYWNPAPAPLRYKRRSDYEEAIRESLDVAVEAMLRGAGNKVGSHLSSGLDSSAVTATAARLMGRSRSVVAYTATPREGYGASNLGDSIVDEWGLAAKVAGLYPNIEHVRVQTGPSSPVELLDKYFYLYQRPFLNLCNGVWAHAILADARQRGLQVFLTGRGGNSSFSYDGMVALPAMLRKGQLIRLAHSVALLRKRHIRWGTMTAQCLGPFLPDFAWRAVKRLRGRSHKLTDFTALHSDAASQLMASSKAGGVPLDPASRPTADAGEARRRIREFADSGNYNKAALGGWGIDYRDPASDRRLVELCLSIPAEEFLGPLPRDLARRTFADRLPREIVEERRKGYQAADWHEGFTAALPQIEEELERVFSAGGADDLLDSRKMKQLLASCPSDGWNDFANVQKYRMSLLRGISAGHFLRRAKGSNA